MTLGLCFSTYLEFEAFELIVTRRPDTVSVTRFARTASAMPGSKRSRSLSHKVIFARERQISTIPFDKEPYLLASIALLNAANSASDKVSPRRVGSMPAVSKLAWSHSLISGVLP